MNKIVIIFLSIVNMFFCVENVFSQEEGKNPFVSFLDRKNYEQTQKILEQKRIEEQRKIAEEDARRIESELARREEESKIIQEQQVPEDSVSGQLDMMRVMGEPEPETQAMPGMENYAPAQESIMESYVELPTLEINGIIWNVEKPSVIIQNRVYFIGDKIASEIDVVSVGKEGVGLMYKGKMFTLNIPMVLDNQEADTDLNQQFGQSGNYYGVSQNNVINEDKYVEMRVE
ncbi:hypothetical protein KKC59_04670 [bacterium]|nr:hypothetical protein [bacterium]